MRLAVTGLGMVSPLGPVVPGCAALRCGMARPAPLDFQVVSSGEDMPGVEAVTGHPLSDLTGGFTGVGLHALLAHHALGDLLSYAGLGTSEPGYARGEEILVWSRSESGEVASGLVMRP